MCVCVGGGVCLGDECVSNTGGLCFKLDNRASFLRPRVTLCRPIECL